MATINNVTERPDVAGPGFQRSIIKVLWEAMGDADTGTQESIANYSDRTVQVTGTFGGATVTIQGSNDGTNWTTLSDHLGSALTFTSAGISLIAENPLEIRAVTSGGNGTDVDVTIVGKYGS